MPALCFFALGFVELAVGMWPTIVPPSLGIWAAVSPPVSRVSCRSGQRCRCRSLFYMVYWYRVFRGKVLAGEGYH